MKRRSTTSNWGNLVTPHPYLTYDEKKGYYGSKKETIGQIDRSKRKQMRIPYFRPYTEISREGMDGANPLGVYLPSTGHPSNAEELARQVEGRFALGPLGTQMGIQLRSMAAELRKVPPSLSAVTGGLPTAPNQQLIKPTYHGIIAQNPTIFGFLADKERAVNGDANPLNTTNGAQTTMPIFRNKEEIEKRKNYGLDNAEGPALRPSIAGEFYGDGQNAALANFIDDKNKDFATLLAEKRKQQMDLLVEEGKLKRYDLNLTDAKLLANKIAESNEIAKRNLIQQSYDKRMENKPGKDNGGTQPDQPPASNQPATLTNQEATATNITPALTTTNTETETEQDPTDAPTAVTPPVTPEKVAPPPSPSHSPVNQIQPPFVDLKDESTFGSLVSSLYLACGENTNYRKFISWLLFHPEAKTVMQNNVLSIIGATASVFHNHIPTGEGLLDFLGIMCDPNKKILSGTTTYNGSIGHYISNVTSADSMRMNTDSTSFPNCKFIVSHYNSTSGLFQCVFRHTLMQTELATVKEMETTLRSPIVGELVKSLNGEGNPVYSEFKEMLVVINFQCEEVLQSITDLMTNYLGTYTKVGYVESVYKFLLGIGSVRSDRMRKWMNSDLQRMSARDFIRVALLDTWYYYGKIPPFPGHLQAISHESGMQPLHLRRQFEINPNVFALTNYWGIIHLPFTFMIDSNVEQINMAKDIVNSAWTEFSENMTIQNLENRNIKFTFGPDVVRLFQRSMDTYIKEYGQGVHGKVMEPPKDDFDPAVYFDPSLFDTPMSDEEFYAMVPEARKDIKVEAATPPRTRSGKGYRRYVK